MKYILEFAKIRDIYLSKINLNKNITNEFVDDEKLVDFINIKKNYKLLKIEWNNTITHLIINRIKERTTIKSVSEFNKLIVKLFKAIIPTEINKILDRSGRYAFHFKENNFYIIIQVDYKQLSQKNIDFFIPTITISTPNNCVKTIEINEENL